MPSGERVTPSGDIEKQVSAIGAELAGRVEELGRDIAATIRADIDFYKHTRVITDDELLTNSIETIRFVFEGLEAGRPFDTSPAVTTGSKRAADNVPLPAVMDAYRVATHYIWDAISDLASWQPSRISREALMRATARLWQAQDLYTDAMTSAYRQQAMQQVLEDEAERAALAEALLQGRIFDDRSIWEIADLLRLPSRGPYVIIAAESPVVGKQAVRGIAGMLNSVDVSSAARSADRHRPYRVEDRPRCAAGAAGTGSDDTSGGQPPVRQSRRHRAGAAVREDRAHRARRIWGESHGVR
jgi:hypothetical protein